MKLHELSKDKVNEEGLFWLVAVRDTVDWKGFLFEDKKGHIKNEYPQAVIKEGEIVWYCEYDLNVGGDKTQLLFDNEYEVNYFKTDFRKLTPEEETQYLNKQ